MRFLQKRCRACGRNPQDKDWRTTNSVDDPGKHKSFQSTAIYTRMLALDVKHEVERTHPRAKRKLTKKPSRQTPPPANLEP